MQEMKEKYDPDKIFKEREKARNERKNKTKEEIQNLPILKTKENIIQKIIKFINKLFKNKNGN